MAKITNLSSGHVRPRALTVAFRNDAEQTYERGERCRGKPRECTRPTEVDYVPYYATDERLTACVRSPATRKRHAFARKYTMVFHLLQVGYSRRLQPGLSRATS